MPTVTFTPDDISVEVEYGETLLRAALIADVGVTASCGGSGTCGKCRFVVTRGAVEGGASPRLSEDEMRRGYVLGCGAKVTGDVEVTVPAESRPGTAPKVTRHGRVANRVLTAHELGERVPQRRLLPPVCKLAVEAPAPDLSDNASDLTRILNALRREHRVEHAGIAPEALRWLPSALREGGWAVTLTLLYDGESQPTIVAVEPGDRTGEQRAVAVDIGTTTVAVSLLDLSDGTLLAQRAEYNAQAARGADVISRVVAASTDEGLQELRRLVTATIGDLVALACSDAGASPSSIVSYVVAGNTVMTHLLYGVSPASIRTAPYVPAASVFPWTHAADLGLPGGPGAMLGAMPCPASWLGGDVVAGLVASGMPFRDTLTLFIDIGTNGEIVLGDREFMIGCSCSAGPAFEGGGIRHGMRAADGAIEQVRIDDETLEPSILTIGGTRPLGICGSGLIDVVSELFAVGVLERDGNLALTEGSDRVRAGSSGLEYVLVRAEDSGTGGEIVLTGGDIESFMRAKAAIHAGISVIADSLDIEVKEIREVVIAGGFGHHLDLERVTSIGMFPEIPEAEFLFAGNTSLAGASRAALSREFAKDARSAAAAVTYLELSVNAGFMDEYVSSLFLPHTDLALFPASEAARARRASARAAS